MEASKVLVTIRAATASHKVVVAAVDMEVAVVATAQVAAAVAMAPVVEVTEAAATEVCASSRKTIVK